MNGTENGFSFIRRGALIILEGCDRSGKTTQCRKLKESLKKKQIPSETMSFPDRSTITGKIITEYLMKSAELPDKSIHLLFSANRWELSKKIERLIQDGVTVIIDRYAYSGVAFSSIKKDMDLEWCKQPDAGLPKPDKVFLLTLSSESMSKRPGYGQERYERPEIQKNVAELFMKLKDDSWTVVDADNSIDDVHDILLEDVLKTIEKVKHTPLGKLW